MSDDLREVFDAFPRVMPEGTTPASKLRAWRMNSGISPQRCADALGWSWAAYIAVEFGDVPGADEALAALKSGERLGPADERAVPTKQAGLFDPTV